MIGLADLPSGCVVAERFSIERRASRGGMGVVYHATDSHSGRPIALKVLHNTDVELGGLERFLREAEVLKGLQHPGIVAHISHGSLPSGQPYLAMEWLEGEDLSQRLRRGPLPIADTLALVRRLAEALAAAHQHGVIHRDALL